mmetsp:Transcript_14179/g.21290  ORF Transcript_14179/g.21290 Transcript_14179/m.21290 type:complete len:273 (+) Transcript_14179:80-898(+)
MTDWKKVGDSAHLFCMLNAAIFAFIVVMHNESAIFDDVWRHDGFCVSNRDVPYFNSHDLCLYFDTASAIIVGLIYYKFKDTPGMEPANELVKFNVFGIFGHGVGHGFISQAMRSGTVASSPDDVLDLIANSSLIELVQKFGPLLFFWLMLLKATMPKGSFGVVVPMATVAAFMNAIVPLQFGFTFVQTVLLFAFSVNQLMRPDVEKDKVYALYPMYVGCPLSVIAWIESTQCSNFVMAIGGHLIYDAYIPISMIYFYFVCWKDCSQSKVKAD